MKIDKKKLVFGSMFIVILAFMVIYWFLKFGKDAEPENQLDQTTIPLLDEDKKEYKTRMEAVDNLIEKRPSNAPSMYDEALIDSAGNYDPYLPEKEKMKLMDSILASGPDIEYFDLDNIQNPSQKILDSILPNSRLSKPVEIASIGNGHLDFFLNVSLIPNISILHNNKPIYALVNGDQVVRENERLELRLSQDLMIAGDSIPKNTILYGSCSFKANRLLLTIYPTGSQQTPLKAFDISDGQEGIYIENSFRSQATTEVFDDVIQDINISGVPQVSGLKSIFQRSNRNVKVKVFNQYQLILKPIL